MNYLSVENVAKSFDERQLFEGLTFGLDQGQKAALVGVNGCGKSTLLKIIAGLETPDRGEVSFRKGIRVSILPQNPDFDDADNVVQAVFAEDIDELNVIRDYELALHQATVDPENAPDLTSLIDKMDQLSAWDYESQVKQLLGELGIHRLDQKMGELSGGQRKRVALARALIVNPDFLILDEPTNHLDLEVIEWLENYLATANMTLLMVTHDRYFLDRVTNEILEIDQGELFRYKGNYQNFLEKKAEREAQDAATVDKARNLLRKELDWMRRQPKARGTKAKYRVDAFYETKETASKNVNRQEMEVNLTGERQGKKILIMEQVSKRFDDLKILEHFNHTFQRKERVGIVGPNGVGKSTFLHILTGEISPDTGKREVGQTTKFGFYTQEEQQFDPNMRVLDVVQEVAEVIKLSDGSVITASQLLNQFLFPPKMQFNVVGKLSGGERRRLQLLRVLMENPNFLILDEPTNDLDLMTLNVLEEYLENFEGCLMIVSHDRYFMDRLTDHLFVFEGSGKVRDFPGNYTDLRASGLMPSAMQQKPETKPKEKEQSAQSTEAPKESKKKLSYNEQREFDGLEGEIAKLEERKTAIEQEMNQKTDFEELQQLAKDLDTVKATLEEKEMRWLELSERA
ncbi:ABC-F family ATP-binding cassette domain-containing protein [Marinoscillum furvescens]|uniref:ATP-binding cassette subfamily F protein uup n=1 Tax=Marinoscillum furvescens DSM 4134 TaxID=1122208 RepID=A0A3D9L1U0_MARFU|nr:ABC-F family ATP-binding cassette domain-containing protein [Marinoscillum furvescens]RED97067.1 ATP-binding cassette subfamily F protein uup [Marinoscillum furvescens DSM 4134]